uniref:Uncharacterized protein n=1 Tax=Rhizophora mucronata TaxID=61149 RepID=A0A2P2N9N1_RHIMU
MHNLKRKCLFIQWEFIERCLKLTLRWWTLSVCSSCLC